MTDSRSGPDGPVAAKRRSLGASSDPLGPIFRTVNLITIYGVAALTFMMLMYSLEQRGARFVFGFAVGCALSSAYGFLSGAWPFGVVEIIWCAIALGRFARAKGAPADPG
jgi:hypothetical protein